MRKAMPARSAARNADHLECLEARQINAPFFCPCSECWNQHYDSVDERRSRIGWHPLRAFWQDVYINDKDDESVDFEAKSESESSNGEKLAATTLAFGFE